MAQNYAVLDNYFVVRDQLLTLLREQQAIATSLQMTRWQETLEQLEQNLLAENFKVMIVGEFKTGKSTFINAMLRERVLPAFAIPCTAIINEVKWAEEKRAVLHYIADDNGDARPPLPISIEDLEKYVVIQDTSDTNKDLDQNPFERAELFWPLDLCRNGVEIIDSPGLNENPKRQAVTLSYLPRTDAVVFVCSSLRIGPSISEQATIDDLHAYGYEDIFFVCNQFDMITEGERDRLMRHARRQLGQLTAPHGERRVFFISAKQALDGQLRESGLLALEDELTRFLAEEKGKLRFKRVVKKLREVASESRQTIIYKEGMLRTKLEDLNARVQDARDELKDMEKQRERINRTVDSACRDLRDEVRQEAIRFFNRLTVEIPQWVGEYKLTRPLNYGDVTRIEQAVNRVSEEVVGYIARRVDVEADSWRQEALTPFIEERLERLRLSLDSELRLFVQRLDDLQLAVAGVSPDTKATGERVSAVDRVLSTVGGFFLGGIGSAAVGAMFGYKEMLKSLLPQIAIAVGVGLLFGFQPWLIIPAMLAGGFVQGIMKMQATNDQIKQQISVRIVDELRGQMNDQAKALADQLYDKLQIIGMAINEGLDNEVRAFEDNMRNIQTRKERGEEKQEQLLLEDASRRLDKLNAELGDFVDSHLVIVGD